MTLNNLIFSLSFFLLGILLGSLLWWRKGGKPLDPFVWLFKTAMRRLRGDP